MTRFRWRLAGGGSRRAWPIIVGGCHRSGTSLVRRILNAHSRIYCGPEVKFFRDFYGDYQSDPLRHGRFTSSARSLLPEADRLEILGRGYVELQKRAAARAGKVRWADKNPENVLYLRDWQRLLGDRWLLIHVVRNPLDTLASIKEVGFPLVIPTALDGRVAHYWRYTQAGLSFGAIHADRYYRVLYEQLVQSPQPTLDGLMRWLDERLEPSQLAFNDVPQQSGLEDPKIAYTTGIHSTSVGHWRARLTAEEAHTIWRETRAIWAQIDPDGRYAAPSRDIDG